MATHFRFSDEEQIAFAVPLAAGFVAANLGRSAIGSVAAWAVIAVPTVADYRRADADPVTGPWLRLHIDAVPATRVSTLERHWALSRHDPRARRIPIAVDASTLRESLHRLRSRSASEDTDPSAKPPTPPRRLPWPSSGT